MRVEPQPQTASGSRGQARAGPEESAQVACPAQCAEKDDRRRHRLISSTSPPVVSLGCPPQPILSTSASPRSPVTQPLTRVSEYSGDAVTAFPKPASAPSQPQAGVETVLHDRRITVDGVETQYLEAGAGPPLLLLHGHEQSATSWRWVIPALARTHRVLALSLPGHGESGPAADGHAPGADLAPFVAAFLVAVGTRATARPGGRSSAAPGRPAVPRWPTPPRSNPDPCRQRGHGPRVRGSWRWTPCRSASWQGTNDNDIPGSHRMTTAGTPPTAPLGVEAYGADQVL